MVTTSVISPASLSTESCSLLFFNPSIPESQCYCNNLCYVFLASLSTENCSFCCSLIHLYLRTDGARLENCSMRFLFSFYACGPMVLGRMVTVCCSLLYLYLADGTRPESCSVQFLSSFYTCFCFHSYLFSFIQYLFPFIPAFVFLLSFIPVFDFLFYLWADGART